MPSRPWRIRLEAMFSLLGGNLALCSLFLVYLDETEPAFGRYPLSNKTTWQFLSEQLSSGSGAWAESAPGVILMAAGVAILSTSAICLIRAGKYVSWVGMAASVIGLLISLLSFGWLVYVYIPSLQPPLITYFPGPGVWLPLVEFFVSAAALFAINRQVADQRRSHVPSV